MAGWEALWQSERDAIVAKINAGGYGIAADGTSALISSGYRIDLSRCPSNWSNTEGLTDTEIRLGQTALLSGTLAQYAPIAAGLEIYLADLNRRGITDTTGRTRTFDLIIRDEGYASSRTHPAGGRTGRNGAGPCRDRHQLAELEDGARTAQPAVRAQPLGHDPVPVLG